MKKSLLAFSLLISSYSYAQFPCVDGLAAGIYPCDHVELAKFMALNEVGVDGNTNDVWGWVSPTTGKEYALLGGNNGTAFIDVSDPGNPIYLGLLPTHTIASLWRDLESLGNYCYIGSEAPGHGLQIFDLLQLDDVTNPPVLFEETAHYDGFGNSHTINIDPVSGYLYAMGTNTFSGGLHIVDINNPLNPTIAGGFSQDGYTHDGYAISYNGPDEDWIGKEVVVGCNADALTFIDVNDKSDCQMISTLDYPELGYVHQGWFTKDFKYFLLDDELDEQDFTVNTRTHMFDVQDLDNPVYMGYYQGESTSIDHNLYIKDQFVFESNYRSGVRILDASRTSQSILNEIGYFDLFPNNDFALFSGTWSNYPFLPSGIVLATSMYDGFFILKPHLVDLPAIVPVQCDTQVNGFQITINADLQFPLTISAADVPEEWTASGPVINGPGTYDIVLSGGWDVINNATLVLSTNFGSTYEFQFSTDLCENTVNELAENNSLIVFPNPANERVFIDSKLLGGQIEIFDMTGRMVDSTRISNARTEINTSRYPQGLYIIKANNQSVLFEKL